MNPVEPSPAQLAFWAEVDPHGVTIGGPAEGPDVVPCPAVVTFPEGRGAPPVLRVAWRLDEIELAQLARGGTLWLSTWGGLPIHQIEVQPPS